MSLSIYNLALYFYYFAIVCYSMFNKKAKLWIYGRKQTQYLVDTYGLNEFKGAILCHASSLGEFEQLRPLIERIKTSHPQEKIIVSFFSPSGFEVRKNYELADKVLYLPFDQKKQIQSFLAQLLPKVIIIVRYEFWINTITTAKQLNIPIFLIAASFRKEQIFFRFYGSIFKKLLLCYQQIFVVQSNNIELLQQIGISTVTFAPDTRIDRVVSIAVQQKEIPLITLFLENTECSIVAGSTWDSDLAVILPYIHLYPNKKYIIAPHHIDEKSLIEIESKLTIPNIRYSKLSDNFTKGTNVLIIDNFGMLASLYSYGKFAYIGGGFGSSVHNALEAVVYKKPVFFGPHYKKAIECINLIELQAAYCVLTSSSLSTKIALLESSEIAYNEVSHRAYHYIETNKGGSEIIYKYILPFLA